MQFFLLKHGESRLIEIKEADKDGAEDGEGEKTVELDVPVMNDDNEEEKPAEETSPEDAALLDQLVNEVTADDNEEERKSDSD